MYGVARVSIGILGNILSLFLRLSPTPTFIRIYREKSTASFHPYPYLAAILNCIIWILYRLPLLHPDVLLLVVNAVGLAISLIYVIIFFVYTTKKYRVVIVITLLGVVALLAVTAVITFLCFHSHGTRSMFIGIICVVINVVMFASPLSIIRQVMQTRSPEFMPFWLCVAGLAYATVLLIYSFLEQIDLYNAIANGIGALFGIVQLSVYAYYSLQANGTKAPSV